MGIGIVMKILEGILLFFVCISFVYYAGIILYAGISVRFGFFWALFGAGGLASFFLCRKLERLPIRLLWELQAAAIGALCLAALLFFILEGILLAHAVRKPEEGADYLIALGAGLRGTVLTSSLKKRLDKALEYLGRNGETRVIVSGGQGKGEDIPESLAMKKYLVENGILENRIIEENQSVNTNENISFSKKYIEGTGKKIVIVTSGYHVFRGTAIARKQDLGYVEGFGAPSDPVLLVHFYVREAFAVIKDKLAGNI